MDDEDDDFFDDLDQEELAELDDLDRSYAATQPKSINITNKKSPSDIEENLRIKTDELQRAIGEIHLVRSKLDQLSRQRDQETSKLREELETQASGYRNQLEQLQKTVDRMNTEASFMKRELQDVTQRYSLLANRKLSSAATRSPSPSRFHPADRNGSMIDFEASLKDGFDPRLSPSRKRKRTVAAVHMDQPQQPVVKRVESGLHSDEETHIFISQLVNLCDSNSGRKLVEANADLSGCLYEVLGNANQLDSKPALVKDIVVKLVGLWSRQSKNDDGDAVLQALTFVFEVDDTNVCSDIQIVNQISKIAVDKLSSSCQGVFKLLEHIGINCCVDEVSLARFCFHINDQLVTDLVNTTKPFDTIMNGVRLISICLDYWFGESASTRSKERIIGSLAKITNQSFTQQEQQGSEWSRLVQEILAIYKDISLRPEGIKLLLHHGLISLVACLDQYIQLLRYTTADIGRHEFVEIVRQAVSLVHGINILHPTEVAKILPTKSTYGCLVTMAAVGFSANDDEIVDCAREMLELNLTMEEADRMHEAMNVQ